MQAMICWDGVHFSWKKQGDAARENVLTNIDLQIAPGSFVCILGANGSGKSTLAKLANGLFLPTGGRVYAAGMDTMDESLLYEIRRRIGLVFQNPDNQIVNSIVADDVAFAPENLGILPEEIAARVDEALSAVRMDGYRGHATHLLSGGEKQRLAIAGILAMRPECIVLDEPTAMLDPLGRAEVLETILRLRAEFGITIVLITHHMNECTGADRLIVLDQGRVALDGVPRDVFHEVQKLRALGLELPQTVQVQQALYEAGIALPHNALTVAETIENIAAALR